MNTPGSYRTMDTAGQITAVITQLLSLAKLPAVARLIMDSNPAIEQVGSLRGNRFTMMGNELSINGALAAAYLLCRQQDSSSCRFTTSGLPDQLIGRLTKTQVAVTFPSSLIQIIKENQIFLQGIAYQVIPGLVRPVTTDRKRSQLQSFVNGTPAAGTIYYQDDTIQPLVYVKATDTYVWEQACGSGSLAFSLLTGVKQVIQPSGKTINIQINKQSITVSSTVKEL